MTVSSTTSRKTFSGDAVTTSFGTTPLVFFDEDDLDVYIVTTATGAVLATLTVNTHFTVSGGDGSVGTLDLSAGSSPYGAPASGTTLVIVRNLDVTQESDLVNNDGSDAEVQEDAFDRLTMIAQQLDARIERSFRLPDSDISGASTELPTPEASKIIGWNDDADELVNYSAADLDLVLVTPFVQTIIDDADAEALWETIRNALDADTAPAVDDEVFIRSTADTAGRRMTLQNLLKVINGISVDSTPDRAADYLLSYDASASAAKKVLMQELPLPRSYLAGGTLSNNSGDATNDIDIAAGEARDSTNTVNIRWSALTKQLDASFAAGTAAGGRSAVGAISDTTWHVFAIRKDSDGTGDVLFDTSATAPTMPSGYTYFRRIGSIIRGSGAIVTFSQLGDEFLLKTPVRVEDTSDRTSATSLTLGNIPLGIQVRAIIGAVVNDQGSGSNGDLLTSLDITDNAPSQSDTPGYHHGGANAAAFSMGSSGGTQPHYVRTNTSAQIRLRSTAAGCDRRVITYGWIDRRGRDD